MANLLSVNVGGPQQHLWQNTLVTTSIFKLPVEGPVAVRGNNLVGDEQSDLSAHGGVNKAVYAYPREHYGYWETMRIGKLAPGIFGENLTTEGLLESDIHIGDELEIGSARFVVTQPRSPCYKLQVRFNRAEMTKLFYNSRRFGFYLRVLAEGTLTAGDSISVSHRDPNSVSIADVIALYTGDLRDDDVIRRAIRVEALPPGWRNGFEELLAHRRSADATG